MAPQPATALTPL
jgi:Ca2+-binding RTX toxin-like protein